MDYVIFVRQMNDRLKALQLFLRVAKTRSFSAAGRELKLSQPSASRLIAALEDEIGSALFIRTTRAVTLTEAGIRYAARVEQILANLAEADHDARGTGEFRGILRVGLPSTFAIRAVIPRLPIFQRHHPALHLQCLISDEREDLVAEGYDVSLRVGPLKDSTAVAKRVGVWPYAMAASPGYLAERGMPKKPGDLVAHNVINNSLGRPTNCSFRKNNRVLSVRLESHLLITLNEGCVAAAVAGAGIMLSGILTFQNELASGALTRVLPDWDLGSAEINAIFPSPKAMKASARGFVEFLIAELERSAPTQRTVSTHR
jgi:DNA-binding transcriptional LysR family regulator